ncbi:MAG: hypothetical protein EZS28_042168 [Streblomastix strix]|uniref:Uncharacterized protein n=1 Tax=Streblomastix strix TaxID=222440 RepID=A0A5J4TY27_9EUKA|nr:MAG: hypothetical protein EZS28_042168 [Streblomastix strix]
MSQALAEEATIAMINQLYPEAIELFSQSMQWEKNSPFIMMSRGDCRKAMKQYAVAMDDYVKALKMKPQDQSILYRMSSIHDFFAQQLVEVGRYEDALVECNLAVESSPQICEFRMRRADIYLILGKTKEAYDDVQAAHTIDPDSAKISQRLLEFIPGAQLRPLNLPYSSIPPKFNSTVLQPLPVHIKISSDTLPGVKGALGSKVS